MDRSLPAGMMVGTLATEAKSGILIDAVTHPLETAALILIIAIAAQFAGRLTAYLAKSILITMRTWPEKNWRDVPLLNGETWSILARQAALFVLAFKRTLRAARD